MNPRIIFEPEARVEFVKAKDRYRRESPQKARAFDAAMRECLNQIEIHPDGFQSIYRSGVRRIRFTDFPFNLIYFIDPDAIFILAVAHNARDPEYWLHRIPEEN